MNKMVDMLGRWQLDMKKVREQMYRAPTPRERERWHAIWLLARGESHPSYFCRLSTPGMEEER